MNSAVEFALSRASESEIASHLMACDSNFMPPLSGRVNIERYSKKIASRATRFEAWSGGALIGLVATYCNDDKNLTAYITSVSVLEEWAGTGIATRLVRQCIAFAKDLGMNQVSLQVAMENVAAIRVYQKSGFVSDNSTGPLVTMNLYLDSEEESDRET